MNSERIVERKRRNRIAEYTLITNGRETPYEVFRAATIGSRQAIDECNDYNLSLERKYAEGSADTDE